MTFEFIETESEDRTHTFTGWLYRYPMEGILGPFEMEIVGPGRVFIPKMRIAVDLNKTFIKRATAGESYLRNLRSGIRKREKLISEYLNRNKKGVN